MKILLIFSLLTSTLVFSQQKLEISRLRDNFYVYTTYHDLNGTRFPANGMFVVTSCGVVIFDTPWDSTQFQPLLDSIQKNHGPVRMCIATHSHDDRTAGLDYYRSKGIKTFTSNRTDSISTKIGNPRAEVVFESDYHGFEVGQQKFYMIYAGPGHTPDNIVAWFPQEKVLYGGCLIKSTEAKDLGNLTDADVKAWPETMKKLKELTRRRKYVIPGHQSWKNKKSVEHTEKLLKNYLRGHRSSLDH